MMDADQHGDNLIRAGKYRQNQISENIFHQKALYQYCGNIVGMTTGHFSGRTVWSVQNIKKRQHFRTLPPSNKVQNLTLYIVSNQDNNVILIHCIRTNYNCML